MDKQAPGRHNAVVSGKAVSSQIDGAYLQLQPYTRNPNFPATPKYRTPKPTKLQKSPGVPQPFFATGLTSSQTTTCNHVDRRRHASTVTYTLAIEPPTLTHRLGRQRFLATLNLREQAQTAAKPSGLVVLNNNTTPEDCGAILW